MLIYFIINPIAGKNQNVNRIARLLDELNKRFPEANVLFTEKRGDAYKFGQLLSDKQAKVVICGGDGTINEVLNGLGAHSSPIVDIYPIGSGNDLARELKISDNLDYLLNNLKIETFKLIDLGEITLFDEKYTETKHLFGSSCGIGFDALAAHYSNQNSKFKGLLLYLSSVFRALRNYPSSQLSLSIDKHHLSTTSMMVSIGNGKTSGGGFKLLPKAKIDDGELDISIIKYINRIKILFYLPIAIFGKHTKLKIVNYFKFKNCEISLNPGNYVHTDGEVLSTDIKKISIRVLPATLKFRA